MSSPSVADTNDHIIIMSPRLHIDKGTGLSESFSST